MIMCKKIIYIGRCIAERARLDFGNNSCSIYISMLWYVRWGMQRWMCSMCDCDVTLNSDHRLAAHTFPRSLSVRLWYTTLRIKKIFCNFIHYPLYSMYLERIVVHSDLFLYYRDAYAFTSTLLYYSLVHAIQRRWEIYCVG